MRITETILKGNCGEATDDQISNYAKMVEEEFQQNFPTAEITVIVTGETGAGPATSVEFDDNEDYDSTAESIAREIAQNVWDSGNWC